MISFYFRHRIDSHSGASLLIGSQQSLTATVPEIVVPGLASGATYTMAIKVRTTMGDSDYSPPTVSSTIMEQTDLERFRGTLNLDAMENKMSNLHNGIFGWNFHLQILFQNHSCFCIHTIFFMSFRRKKNLLQIMTGRFTTNDDDNVSEAIIKIVPRFEGIFPG